MEANRRSNFTVFTVFTPTIRPHPSPTPTLGTPAAGHHYVYVHEGGVFRQVFCRTCLK